MNQRLRKSKKPPPSWEGDQYGEIQVIDAFFHNQRYLVEVGAADGITNSNSFELIKRGWNAILIEPHPEYFKSLEAMYKDCPNVQLFNCLVGPEGIGEQDFYLFGQCSTTNEDRLEYLKKISKLDGIIKAETRTLWSILDDCEFPLDFDFLSIDCEGDDLKVWDSLGEYRPALVCIEQNIEKEMTRLGYSFYDKTQGNQFYYRVI